MASEDRSDATPQRFTERGAECRKTHVSGYTGPICSCGPTECKATRDESDNQQFNPAPSAARSCGCARCRMRRRPDWLLALPFVWRYYRWRYSREFA